VPQVTFIVCVLFQVEAQKLAQTVVLVTYIQEALGSSSGQDASYADLAYHSTPSFQATAT
jgi:hypothetical protein